jgi:hypothetical protein
LGFDRGPTISERAATVPQTAGQHVPKLAAISIYQWG